MQLSVVIITFNEAHRIKRCIESVLDIADEVLVVDSYSTDKTAEIASGLGAKVVFEKFRGYIEQKNFALSQAKYDFILSLDADEAVDQTLNSEINHLKEFPIANVVFQCNRLNNYAGKWIRHGAWFPDLKIRLFDKNVGKWEGMNPHDRFQPKPGIVVKKLNGEILHWSYNSIRDHEEKILKFSEIAAEAYFKNGKKSSIFKIWLSPTIRFLRDYFLKLGFLDGNYGFTIARLTAREVKLKYQKLMELEQKKRNQP